MSDPRHHASTVGDLLISAIGRGGERTAFVGDELSWTYRQLGELVSQVVQVLTARGLRRGDAVATLSANRPEAFLVTAAAYLMGLRLTWMNPTSSEDDHAYILEDSGVATLFVDPLSFAERAQALARRVPGVQRLLSFGPGCDGAEDQAHRPLAGPRREAARHLAQGQAQAAGGMHAQRRLGLGLCLGLS